MVEVNIATIAAFLTALLAAGIATGAWVKFYADTRVREARLTSMEAWRNEHLDTSHKTLTEMNGKITSIARDLNRLIGKVDAANGGRD